MTESDEDRPPDPTVDDDDDDDEVDDITDVWDEERLKAALGELHKDEQKGPATKSKRALEDSIQVEGPQPPQPSAESKADTDPPPAPGRPGGGLSWPLTIGLAVVLGVAVYLLVTLLR